MYNEYSVNIIHINWNRDDELRLINILVQFKIPFYLKFSKKIVADDPWT